MASQQLDDEQIFHIARRLPDEATRAQYLDQVCAGDLALRERVEALLNVHEQEQSFLQSAKPDWLAPSTRNPLPKSRSGDRPLQADGTDWRRWHGHCVRG